MAGHHVIVNWNDWNHILIGIVPMFFIFAFHSIFTILTEKISKFSLETSSLNFPSTFRLHLSYEDITYHVKKSLFAHFGHCGIWRYFSKGMFQVHWILSISQLSQVFQSWHTLTQKHGSNAVRTYHKRMPDRKFVKTFKNFSTYIHTKNILPPILDIVTYIPRYDSKTFLLVLFSLSFLSALKNLSRISSDINDQPVFSTKITNLFCDNPLGLRNF